MVRLHSWLIWVIKLLSVVGLSLSLIISQPANEVLMKELKPAHESDYDQCIKLEKVPSQPNGEGVAAFNP